MAPACAPPLRCSVGRGPKQEVTGHSSGHSRTPTPASSPTPTTHRAIDCLGAPALHSPRDRLVPPHPCLPPPGLLPHVSRGSCLLVHAASGRHGVRRARMVLLAADAACPLPAEPAAATHSSAANGSPDFDGIALCRLLLARTLLSSAMMILYSFQSGRTRPGASRWVAVTCLSQLPLGPVCRYRTQHLLHNHKLAPAAERQAWLASDCVLP